MPMETARGIIQIESGKNYYWRASRGRAGSFRGRICEYEEEKRSCRSQVEVGGGGGGGGGRISRRGEGERKLERERAWWWWWWWRSRWFRWRERPRHHDLAVWSTAVSLDDPGVITPHSGRHYANVHLLFFFFILETRCLSFLLVTTPPRRRILDTVRVPILEQPMPLPPPTFLERSA